MYIDEIFHVLLISRCIFEDEKPLNNDYKAKKKLKVYSSSIIGCLLSSMAPHVEHLSRIS